MFGVGISAPASRLYFTLIAPRMPALIGMLFYLQTMQLDLPTNVTCSGTPSSVTFSTSKIRFASCCPAAGHGGDHDVAEHFVFGSVDLAHASGVTQTDSSLSVVLRRCWW